MSYKQKSDSSIVKCIALGLIMRLVLVLYADSVDRSDSVVKFTDIDYHVFSDAAKYVSRGNSPYLRATYRYTPLLAWMLVPNVTLNRNWGKLLFVFCDLIAGWLIYRILRLRGLSGPRATWPFAAIWLLNPFVAVISTRGSSEAVLGVLVLGTLYLLLLGKPILAGIIFGLSVHFKIYPIIYALPFLLVMNHDYPGYKPFVQPRESKSLPDPTIPPRSVLLLSGKKKDVRQRSNGEGHAWRREKSGRMVALLHQVLDFCNNNRLTFAFASGGTFLFLNVIMYAIYGKDFLQETYLYHLIRRDHRHNFSPYFYNIYLGFSTDSLPFRLSSFLPFVLQFSVVWTLGLTFWQDPVFACFVQTLAFVTFNKVVTSQYFMWYLSFLPLVLPYSRLDKSKGFTMLLLWVAGQVAWLLNAFFLEHKGWNTFLPIWFSSLVFFFINCWVLVQFIRNQAVTKWFDKGKLINMTQDKVHKNL